MKRDLQNNLSMSYINESSETREVSPLITANSSIDKRRSMMTTKRNMQTHDQELDDLIDNRWNPNQTSSIGRGSTLVRRLTRDLTDKDKVSEDFTGDISSPFGYTSN